MGKRVPLLVRTMRLQSLCVDTTTDVSYTGNKVDRISIVKAMLFRICGPCFLQKIAMLYEKKVVIHDIIESNAVDFFKKDNISDEIPLYRNFTFDMLKENDNLPKRLVVETKDIEVIRELIARGKKLSWFAESLEFGSNFPGLFDFEHIFVNAYSGTGLLLPDGKVRKIRTRRYKKNFTYPFDPEKHVFFNMRYYRFALLEGVWRELGFYPRKFLYYVDRYYLIKNRAILKEKGKISYYVEDKKNTVFNNMKMQISILIVLSVTYMVWKRLNCVTIAKRKIVKKESVAESAQSEKKPVSFAKV